MESFLFLRARKMIIEIGKKNRKRVQALIFIHCTLSPQAPLPRRMQIDLRNTIAPNTTTQRRRNTANLMSALTPLTFVKNNSRPSAIKRERIPRPSTMREELIHNPYKTNRPFIAIVIYYYCVKIANCLIIIPFNLICFRLFQ